MTEVRGFVELFDLDLISKVSPSRTQVIGNILIGFKFANLNLFVIN